ncbi:MAG: exodeoxyribonuclease VII large subunit [Xanthobacteraceae bacterium]
MPKSAAKSADAPEMRANTAEFTVSELSSALKRTVEDAYGHVRVRGEISGFRGPHGSGHCYFALKDTTAKIEAVIWKGTHARMRFKPQEGLEVIATGKLTTYPGSSKYQIVIEALEPAGIGALMALLEERKKTLAAEGLFDPARKQLLPWLPETIGIVTSPTGAVIRDILHRLADRFPRRVLVWPVRVQGEGSAEQIAAAIRGFNAFTEGGRFPRPDLLIVARGGGSLEDLWSFNEEIVVRAAADSMIPLISAVGHETDVTLIDFAADKRAPTPTAAAEMAVPVRSELAVEVASLARRSFACWQRGQEARRNELRSAVRALPSREELFAIPRQRLDHVSAALPRALRTATHVHHRRLASAGAALTPRTLRLQIESARDRMRTLGDRSAQCIAVQSARRRERFATLAARLEVALRANAQAHRQRIARDLERTSRLSERSTRALKVLLRAREAQLQGTAQMLGVLSYRSVLARGYALVRDANGLTLRKASSVMPGAHLTLEFADGKVDVTAHGESAASARPRHGSARARPGSPDQGKLF